MEFIVEYQSSITFLFLTICLVVQFIQIKKYTIIQIPFLIALFISWVVNLIGLLPFDNILLFGIGISFLSFLFYIIFFMLHTNKKILKTIQWILILSLMISFVIYFIIKPLFTEIEFQEFNFINTIIVTVSIFLYMLDVFFTDKILNLTKEFPFWIALGYIVLYLCLIPVLSIQTKSLELYCIILIGLNVIGYGIMMIGRIKTK